MGTWVRARNNAEMALHVYLRYFQRANWQNHRRSRGNGAPDVFVYEARRSVGEVFRQLSGDSRTFTVGQWDPAGTLRTAYLNGTAATIFICTTARVGVGPATSPAGSGRSEYPAVGQWGLGGNHPADLNGDRRRILPSARAAHTERPSRLTGTSTSSAAAVDPCCSVTPAVFNNEGGWISPLQSGPASGSRPSATASAFHLPVAGPFDRAGGGRDRSQCGRRARPVVATSTACRPADQHHGRLPSLRRVVQRIGVFTAGRKPLIYGVGHPTY